MPDSLFTPTEVTADLHLLEKTLHQLSVDYELFFAARADGKLGVQPPHRRLAEVDAIVRHFVKHPPHRTVDRFKFNTLVHRYRTSWERWRRRMKTLEELGATRAAAAAAHRHVEDLSRPQVLLATRLRRGEASPTQLRDVYLAYRTARKARGLSVTNLAYTPFADKVADRLESARRRNPGRDLELRIDELGGQVRVGVRCMARHEDAESPATPVGGGAAGRE